MLIGVTECSEIDLLDPDARWIGLPRRSLGSLMLEIHRRRVRSPESGAGRTAASRIDHPIFPVTVRDGVAPGSRYRIDCFTAWQRRSPSLSVRPFGQPNTRVALLLGGYRSNASLDWVPFTEFDPPAIDIETCRFSNRIHREFLAIWFYTPHTDFWGEPVEMRSRHMRFGGEDDAVDQPQ